ncbi:MAG: hypothetical protein V3V08_21275 [Nannocystaceae bacterium]
MNLVMALAAVGTAPATVTAPTTTTPTADPRHCCTHLSQLSTHLRSLVSQPTAANNADLRAHEKMGLPPPALVGLAHLVRLYDRRDLLDMVSSWSHHRSPAVRAATLWTWTTLDRSWAPKLLRQALDDPSAAVRKRAHTLIVSYPDPRLEAHLLRHLAAGEASAVTALTAVATPMSLDALRDPSSGISPPDAARLLWALLHRPEWAAPEDRTWMERELSRHISAGRQGAP